MKLQEIQQKVTIDGVSPKVHNLVHSSLKKIAVDTDLKAIMPFYKHVKIRQDKNNPNLVTVTFRLPQWQQPAPGEMHFVNSPGRPSYEIAADEFRAKYMPVARELESHLKSAVRVEDSSIEALRGGVRLFVVSDDFLG